MTWVLQPFILVFLGHGSESAPIRHAAADARKLNAIRAALVVTDSQIWIALYVALVAHRILTYPGDLRQSTYKWLWFLKYPTAVAISYYINLYVTGHFQQSTWLVRLILLVSAEYLFNPPEAHGSGLIALFRIPFAVAVDTCANTVNLLCILFLTVVLTTCHCILLNTKRVHWGPTRAQSLPIPDTTSRPSSRVCGKSDYTYDQLPGPSTTRVIIILPSATSGPCCDGNPFGIECQMQEVQLDVDGKPRLEYEALSYCWGPPNQGMHIACHGRRLKVTQSLYGALR
jgi:hypothetical protein